MAHVAICKCGRENNTLEAARAPRKTQSIWSRPESSPVWIRWVSSADLHVTENKNTGDLMDSEKSAGKESA